MTRQLLWTATFILTAKIVFGTSGRDSVYTNLGQAFKNPDKVKVLDLRGQYLDSIPRQIGQFKNLEVLLLSSKLRNLWLYPKAWPYKFGLKHLPAGGYAHLQGRGHGRFYKFNKIDNLPYEISTLTNLKLLDIRNTGINVKEWTDKLKSKNPDIIVLTYKVDKWEDFDNEYAKAKLLLDKYEIK